MFKLLLLVLLGLYIHCRPSAPWWTPCTGNCQMTLSMILSASWSEQTAPKTPCINSLTTAMASCQVDKLIYIKSYNVLKWSILFPGNVKRKLKINNNIPWVWITWNCFLFNEWRRYQRIEPLKVYSQLLAVRGRPEKNCCLYYI